MAVLTVRISGAEVKNPSPATLVLKKKQLGRSGRVPLGTPLLEVSPLHFRLSERHQNSSAVGLGKRFEVGRLYRHTRPGHT